MEERRLGPVVGLGTWNTFGGHTGLAERPSSGYMPECAARPWKRTSIDCEYGAPRITSPIGAAWS